MTNHNIENPYKVRLTVAGNINETVSFDASPTVSENRNVNYSSLEPLHAPGQIQVYKNTSSRNYQLSDVKLISRTLEEADRNMEKLWLLRGWCMPRFGNNSTTLTPTQRNRRRRRAGNLELDVDRGLSVSDILNKYGNELLGAGPPILYLSAYSKMVGASTKNSKTGAINTWEIAQHINKVPVVLQQLTIPYPNDTDYVTTSSGVPMPSIMNIDLALLETHSPNSYEGFSLNNFKEGILQGF